MHYAGPQLGMDRVPYFACSDVTLRPYKVGLNITDSFALEVPLVTTTHPGHSPEIAYLEHGVNGYATADDVESYAEGIVRVLTDQALAATLRAGCRSSAAKYTLGEMVRRFADGIEAALTATGQAPGATSM